MVYMRPLSLISKHDISTLERELQIIFAHLYTFFDCDVESYDIIRRQICRGDQPQVRLAKYSAMLSFQYLACCKRYSINDCTRNCINYT